ncbi:ATP-binding cassette domain-containing protein [bacterium SCSIO 12741]|nr:ATP-binding cassette domain-containing protein [bacterium SCSIO 12741]
MNQENTLSPTQRLWRLLNPDRREITNIYVYSIFNGLVNLSLPLGIQAIINLIQGGRVSTSWVVLVVMVVLGVAVTGILQIFQLRITENLQQKIFTRSAFEFAYRIPRIRMEALYRHYAPELMNRFFDTISVQKGLSKILIDFSAAALQVIFGLVLLSLYHPFFIIFSFILVVMVYAIFRLTGARGLRTSLAESKHKYEVAHWLEELARTNTTFKLAGKTNLPLARTDKQVDHYLTARDGHFRVLVQQYSLMVIFKVLVATGLLAIGGILVMQQQMNIGQFVAAEIIILLVMTSVEKFVLSLETIYDVLTSLEKIGQVTDLELESDEGLDLNEQCREPGVAVELDRVGFTYPGNRQPTLNDLSLKIAPGEKVLVTGENGSGKSTLLQIIAGLYQVQEGVLTFNGFPKGNLHPTSLRAVIGDSLSQEQLFEGTVLENITMGREAATFENVKWAVEHLGLSHFINRMPMGYNTVLDPEGKRLPKSVVQKMLLARSIADRPKLLLLEDTFELVEVSERRRIIDFLTNPENGWTLVAVSTDPYLARRFDTAVLLEKGRVTSIDIPNIHQF